MPGRRLVGRRGVRARVRLSPPGARVRRSVWRQARARSLRSPVPSTSSRRREGRTTSSSSATGQPGSRRSPGRREWFRGDVWRAFFAGQLRARPTPRSWRGPTCRRRCGSYLNESARQGPVGLGGGRYRRGEPGTGSRSPTSGRRSTSGSVAPTHWVPRSHADYLVETIPRTTLVSFPGGGHLFPFDHWAEMLAALG